jgi:hypothetical protein
MITNGVSCTREIQSRFAAMAKAAFINKNNLFTRKIGLNLGKKLVNCYIRSIAVCGAETWTLQKVDQRYMESMEMWCWRRMEKISCTNRVSNHEELNEVKEERNILHTTKRRKANWIGTHLHRKCFLKHVIAGNVQGRIELMRIRGRKCKQPSNDFN